MSFNIHRRIRRAKDAAARKRQSRPVGDREVQPNGSVVSAVCRDCGKRREMEAVYRMCRRCLSRRTLAALEEEFPSEPEPVSRRRIYP